MDTTPTTTPFHTEVAVVGAGFAGLQAALVLGRAQRQVVVVGHGPTRNAEASHTHNLLTREGATPSELLAAGRADAAALANVTLLDALVDAVLPPDGEGAPLRLRLSDGRALIADHVVLATGARDALPPVPGLVDLWGRRAHSCPFCDAAPYTGRRLLVLAGQDAAHHLQTLLSGWTDEITVLDPDDVAVLEERDGDVAARTHDGRDVRADGVFVATTPLPRLDPVADLELAHRGPYLAVDAHQRTTLPGLLAVGDCAWRDGASAPGGQVVAALAEGAAAAMTIIVARTGLTVPEPPPAAAPARTARAGASHGRPPDAPEDTTAVEFWESRYAERDRVWTGRPNRGLVEALVDIAPGTALDLGCGEGGDAVWLAEQGWDVTAVDIAGTALRRGAAAAADRGVATRVTWMQADLADGVPEGSWDLVVASYLLSPVALPREVVLRAARDRVARGGLLIILSHLAATPGSSPPAHVDFPNVDEQLAALDLDNDWDVLRAELLHPRMLAPDGTVTHREDSCLVARRVR
ncbi:MAG: FAD-dependent oxidoreductase [Actinobacteria bacterium]|nr:FAD-dependent oxidoreductase [Actinomycetota bacterium]